MNDQATARRIVSLAKGTEANTLESQSQGSSQPAAFPVGSRMDNIFRLEHAERVEAFIDGSNMYGTAKALNFGLNYKAVKKGLQYADLVRIQFFTVVADDNGGADHVGVKPLLDWLSFNGFDVYTRELRSHTNTDGLTRARGSIVPELITNLYQAAVDHRIDRIVLFSGDSDYVPVLKAIKQRGIRITIVSSKEANTISNDMRRLADEFIELNSIAHIVAQHER